MKKSFLWMSAAILTCGLTIASCAKVDYPTGPEDFWEKNTSVIDFEGGDVSMFKIHDAARIAITSVDDATQGKVAEFKCTNRNALPLGYYVFSSLTDKANRVTFEFDFNMSSVSGDSRITIGDANVHTAASGGFSVSSKNNNGYGANGAIFQLGSARGNIGSGTENYFQINGVAKASDKVSSIEIKAAEVFGQWLHAKVVVNVDDRLVSYEVSKEGEILFADDHQPFFNEQAQKCTQFDVSFSNTGTTYIDNLSVESAIDPSIKYAEYIIKYVDPEGNEIKESRIDKGRVGKNASLLVSDTEPVYVDAEGKVIPAIVQDMAEWAVAKWAYDTDDAAETLIAESGSVITVKFKKSEEWNYRLNLVFASDQSRIDRIDGKMYSGDDVRVTYKIGCQNPNDGKWYLAPRENSNDGRGRFFTFQENTAVMLPNGIKRAEQTIEYTLQEDIAFIADFEDKEALTLVGDCDTWIGWTDIKYWGMTKNVTNCFHRFSNGKAARLTEGSYFATPALAAGTYKMFIYGRNGKDGVSQTVALYIMDTKGSLIPVDLTKVIIETDDKGNKYDAVSGGQMGTIRIGGIVIPEGGKLVIKNDGEATYLDLDFIALSLNANADLDALTN